MRFTWGFLIPSRLAITFAGDRGHSRKTGLIWSVSA
jgi:hypothetical protein